MATIKDRSAREKIIRARTNLLVSNGFFGFLAMQLKLVEDYSIPTAAVDGVSMYYNPDFVHQLTEPELEFVMAHEVMHCCFQHMTRRQHRDPRGWNIAGDFVINLDLKEAGFTLIPQGKLINGKPFHILLDVKYKGMNTEEIYEMLPKINIKISGGGNGGGKGDGKDDNDPGMCGGVLDAPGSTAGKAATQQTWETQVRAAVAVAKANNAGQVPGSLQRLVNDLQRPKVSWRDQTRNWIDQSMTKDVSWSRISRRSVSIGVLMPGMISDRLNHLIFVVDDSGSINTKLLTAFLSEVAGALDQGTADQLSVLYADTRVHDEDHFVPGDLVKPREIKDGGGGTHFRHSFKYIQEKFPDASAIIYLTDMQTCDFGDDPGIPTLWAVYSPSTIYDQLVANAPFGSAIHVSDSIG